MTSSVKRRRTNAQLAELEDLMVAEVEEEHPMTVRHLYYRLCHLTLVGKTEAGYRCIQRLALNLRKEGRIPYEWISDGTRYRIVPSTYDSIEEALKETADFYRRDLLRGLDDYLEIWCESDSIAGVLEPITDRYAVSLMSSRGFSSHTFLYRAAMEMQAIGKPTFVYYIGDYDPSGQLIAENIIRRLREFAPDIDIEFERLLITRNQIERFDLPAKPIKHSTHSARFDDHRAVEAEAMAASRTRAILESAINRHIDKHALEVIQVAEQDERRALNMFRHDWIAEHADRLQ